MVVAEKILPKDKHSCLQINPETKLDKFSRVTHKLTKQEQKEYLLLKRNASKSPFSMGASLQRIRDERLYRGEYKNYEEFCRTEFGYSRQHVTRQIKAAEIVEELKQASDKLVVNVMPTAEAQVRTLIKLDTDKRVEVWNEGLILSNNQVPTASLIRKLVYEELARQKQSAKKGDAEVRLEIGDRVRISDKREKELKAFDGAWGIIESVEDLTFTVSCWNGKKKLTSDRYLTPCQIDPKLAQTILDLLEQLQKKCKRKRKSKAGIEMILRSIGTCADEELTSDLIKVLRSLL